MATALNSNINTIAGIGSILDSLFGKTSTTSKSGGSYTDTKQTQMSDAAVKAMIQSLMEDPSTGLAKVASGARVSGMYNTTSQQLLVNDLISRAAIQTELARSPTTTTRTAAPETTTTKTKGTASSMLPLLGSTMLFSKGKDGKTGFDTLKTAMGGAFGGSADSDFSATLLSAADSELSGMMPSWYGAPAVESGVSEFGNDAIGALISSLTSDGGSGVVADAGSSIVDLVSGAGDFVAGAVDYGKELWDDAAEFVSGWF